MTNHTVASPSRPKKSIPPPWLEPGVPQPKPPPAEDIKEHPLPASAQFDLAEARRIVGELVKLRRDGAIKSERDAFFYANLIRDVGATYTPQSAAASLPVDRVPQPPRGISPQERMEFYRADLARAFGEEFIDHNYHPPGRKKR